MIKYFRTFGFADVTVEAQGKLCTVLAFSGLRALGFGLWAVRFKDSRFRASGFRFDSRSH